MVWLPEAMSVLSVPPTVKLVPAALSKPPMVALPLTTNEPFFRFKLFKATESWLVMLSTNTMPDMVPALRPATLSSKLMAAPLKPLGTNTVRTLFKSGTTPVRFKWPVTAQLLGLNHSPEAPPTQVTESKRVTSAEVEPVPDTK